MRSDRDIRVELGKRCRLLRLKRGLSQLDVVRYFDFSLSHYQKIERGVLDPRLTTLAKLAEVYKVSLAVLLRGVGARNVGHAPDEQDHGEAKERLKWRSTGRRRRPVSGG